MEKEKWIELLNSWENFALIVGDVENYQDHLDQLMEIALSGDDSRYWRAAWLADKINEKNPGLMEPHVKPMIERLMVPLDSGRKRHFLKQISLFPTPDEYDGFLMDFCLKTLTSDHEPPAVRVHAMQVLFNLSEKLPDLKPELCTIIENEMEYHPTPGILTRGKKLVVKLTKQLYRQNTSSI